MQIHRSALKDLKIERLLTSGIRIVGGKREQSRERLRKEEEIHTGSSK